MNNKIKNTQIKHFTRAEEKRFSDHRREGYERENSPDWISERAHGGNQ